MKILNLSSSFATYIHYPILKMAEDFHIEHFTFFFQKRLAYIFKKDYRKLWATDRHSVLIDQKNYKIVKLWKIPKTFFDKLYHFSMYISIIYSVKKGKFDVIHANSIEPNGMVAYLISKKLNIPYVITEHGTVQLFHNINETRKQEIINKYKTVVTNAHTIVSVSNQYKEILHSYWNTANIVTVNNTFNKDIFKPSSDHSLQRDNKNHLSIITVGRFDMYKNHILLIQAFHRLHNDFPNIRLSIIGGDGNLLPLYEKYISENSLQDKITIKDFKPHHDLVNEYYQADLFVFPSVIESFGIVCLEAMACGLPVVASNTQGPSSIIEHDIDGVLFENENLDDLVAKLKDMIENPQKRKQISEQAILKAKLYENKHHELYQVLHEATSQSPF